MKQEPNKDQNTGFRLEGTDTPKPNVRPFRVPEGYFDGLTPRVMQAVRQANEPRSAATVWNTILRPQLLVPAFTVAVLAVVSVVYLFPNEQPQPQLAESTFSLEELDDLGLVDDGDLAAYVEVSEELLPYEEFEATTVVDYLMEEDIASSSMYANDIIL
jgi:hypothetical protein